MSKIGVKLKIDVKKILKEWLFSGKKGTYLDATTFIDLTVLDQYGNSGMITQDPPKNSDQDKGPILGNSSIFWVENWQAPQAQGMQTNNLQQNQTPISNGQLQQPPQTGFGTQQTSGQPPPPPPQQSAGGFIDEDIPFNRFDY